MTFASVTFWTNVPSIHQRAWVAAIARRHAENVDVVTDTDVPRARRRLGWEDPSFDPAALHVAPSTAFRDALLDARLGPGHVHVFSGLGAYRGVARTLRAAVRHGSAHGASIVVTAESGRPTPWPVGLARRGVHAFRAFPLDGRIDAILAFGSMGVDWYRRTGFVETPLVPIAYYLDPRDVERAPGDRDGDGDVDVDVDLVYVGALSRRKGVDVLLAALAHARRKGGDATLTIVGSGREESTLRTLAVTLGVDDVVRWSGPRPTDEARSIVARARYLVLPSRFDGWGSVVVEALLEGTPVITSPHVGARDVVVNAACGTVLPSLRIETWGDALANLDARAVVERRRDSVRRWARSSLSGDAGADHFASIVTALRGSGSLRDGFPSPPWSGSTP